MGGNRRWNAKQDSIGSVSSGGNPEASSVDADGDGAAAVVDDQDRHSRKRWKRKKSSGGGSSSSSRERDLLKKYLQEYKVRMYDHHHLSHKLSSDDVYQNSLMNSTEPIVIYGAEFPRFDPQVLEAPFLALPTKFDGRDRRHVHSICEELGLFHVGLENSQGERYVATSIFHDGFAHAPKFDTGGEALQNLEKFKPWVRQKHVDREQETKASKELVYELFDQPGMCLRDGIDHIDLVRMADEDLSNTTPPQPKDGNWLWVNSTESLERCVLDLLHTNKPQELAFDIECLCRSKIQQLTCLIQLATDDGREYVIDVLADGVWEGVRRLAPLFSDKSVVKVGHGVGGVDVPSLHRDFGIVIVNLFDTLEAARALNMKEKGLARVCAHYKLPHCERYDALKEEYQMTDWTRRPLTGPMILYGRYDVHYLLQLRKLMMRDLVKLSLSANTAPDRQHHGSDALRDIIRALNEEDGIEDEEEEYPGVDRFPDGGDNDEEDALQAYVGDDKSIHTAKDLRMNVDLMHVISSSQNKCLSLWSDKPENHLKNTDYLAMMTQNMKDGKEWSKAQEQLFDKLAQWREEVAVNMEILPGFVCRTDFLVKMTQFRPTSKHGVQQINYFLSPPLTEHLDEMLLLIRQSRAEDQLLECVHLPSFESSTKDRLSPDSSHDEGSWRSNWIYIFAVVGVATATAVWVKRRRRTKNSCRTSGLSCRGLLLIFIVSTSFVETYSMTQQAHPEHKFDGSRRDFGTTAFLTVTAVSGSLASLSSLSTVTLVSPAHAASAPSSLAEKLSQRDPALLSNSVFNLPPPAQVYPTFMRGKWDVTLKYGGYLFSSQKIPRDRLTADVQIPGFQKCSVAALSDVGKDVVQYTLSIDPNTGLEDRIESLTTSINAHLGYPAVQQVLYNPKANPNRLSIVFYEYRTTNAERIELFCNGRESELVQRTEDSGDTRQIFVCSEYIRQVTFGTGSQVGIPRQVGTNYAHFWTWKETLNDPDTMTGNLLTAGYLDPQDALFFEEPSKPVTVYSHIITAKRIG